MLESNFFDITIATLFAVEFFEGSIIVGQYRTILFRSPEWAERREEGLRCINMSAALAVLCALAIIMAVSIPMGILSKELDPMVGKIMEGCSKFVAAFFILKLSLKIPTWLGIYRQRREKHLGLTLKEIRFNVSWNIWREVMEIGVFLFPIILGTGALAIPLSAFVGGLTGLFGGLIIYLSNKFLTSKEGLCVFMCVLLVFLSSGLVTGAVSELEEIIGSTYIVWQVQNPFWSSTKLPMVLLKPFGYTSTRSIFQICIYWAWLFMATCLHFRNYRNAKKHGEKNSDETDEENSGDEKCDSELGIEIQHPEGNSCQATLNSDSVEVPLTSELDQRSNREH